MASVGVVDVRKAYGAQEVIHGVSITIEDGEFVILVGPIRLRKINAAAHDCGP